MIAILATLPSISSRCPDWSSVVLLEFAVIVVLLILMAVKH